MTSTDKKSVCFLPLAGTDNPYQRLTMEGLKTRDLIVKHGCSGKFGVFTRTALAYKPNYIHLDWLQRYYIRRTYWMTWLFYPLFVLDVFIVNYLFDIKLVWTLHNIFPHDRPVFGPYLWARRLFAQHCSWIRVFDEDTIARASKALGVSKEKFRVVPEGDYVGYYPNQISQKQARQQLGIPVDDRVFLYLGLIKPYKGILELIQFFKTLVIPNAKLLVAGKSMDEHYWKAIQAEHSAAIDIREGFIPDDQLQVFFNAADAVVLPFQRIENSGSAILAMGFEKVVVAPKKGVLVSRLKQQAEYLYTSDAEFPQKLIAINKLPKLELQKIGAANRDALKKHKWEDFASCFNINT